MRGPGGTCRRARELRRPDRLSAGAGPPVWTNGPPGVELTQERVPAPAPGPRPRSPGAFQSASGRGEVSASSGLARVRLRAPDEVVLPLRSAAPPGCCSTTEAWATTGRPTRRRCAPGSPACRPGPSPPRRRSRSPRTSRRSPSGARCRSTRCSTAQWRWPAEADSDVAGFGWRLLDGWLRKDRLTPEGLRRRVELFRSLGSPRARALGWNARPGDSLDVRELRRVLLPGWRSAATIRSCRPPPCGWRAPGSGPPRPGRGRGGQRARGVRGRAGTRPSSRR